MKRIVTLIALFAFALTGDDQIHFRGGAVAHHYNMRQYNELADSYNKNTPRLTTEMPYQT